MHPLNIIKQPDPTRKPFMVGRMPSQRDGRTLDISLGYTPEGRVRETATDRGLIRDSDDPFFYLCVFGGTISMTQGDMHECVEEMVYTRQQKAKQDPRPIATAKELKNKMGDLVLAVKDARVGRRHF